MWQADEYCRDLERGLKLKESVGYLAVPKQEKSLVVTLPRSPKYFLKAQSRNIFVLPFL